MVLSREWGEWIIGTNAPEETIIGIHLPDSLLIKNEGEEGSKQRSGLVIELSGLRIYIYIHIYIYLYIGEQPSSTAKETEESLQPKPLDPEP